MDWMNGGSWKDFPLMKLGQLPAQLEEESAGETIIIGEEVGHENRSLQNFGGCK